MIITLYIDNKYWQYSSIYLNSSQKSSPNPTILHKYYYGIMDYMFTTSRLGYPT